jgi:hypothetical protein
MIFRVWLLLDCNGDVLDVSDESRFSETANYCIYKHGNYQRYIASGGERINRITLMTNNYNEYVVLHHLRVDSRLNAMLV